MFSNSAYREGRNSSNCRKLALEFDDSEQVVESKGGTYRRLCNLDEGRVAVITFPMVRKEERLPCKRRTWKKKDVKVASPNFRTLQEDRLGWMGMVEEPHGFVSQNGWREQEQSGNDQRCGGW